MNAIRCAQALVLASILCAPALPAVPTPLDKPYPGEVRLHVDATDTARRVVHVHESISGLPREATLLYPKWIPGSHAPVGNIDKLAGIRVTAGGAPIAWTRDPVDMVAFHLSLPAGVSSVDVEFDFLAPTSSRVGTQQLSGALMHMDWSDVVLYPAGYYASRIPVVAGMKVPAGWTIATALERTATASDDYSFERTTLETLIDSPVYAGRHAKTLELGGTPAVRLNVFADRADLLELPNGALEAHRALVQQAHLLYGSHHYRHYDFLLTLTDQNSGYGVEHHESSANSTRQGYFSEWDTSPGSRALLTHEYTHSWNGKFRRPADLWTPNYDVPMRNSLLWVYEGQTEYWGYVLAARSGLWTKQQALDAWAETAAYYATQPGRAWRSVADTTNDEIINPRRPMSWENWQRFEDYYSEGALIWLEADAQIRELTHDARSLDDFAHAFFGVEDGRVAPLTYTIDDVVRTLNGVAPFDWATFLRERTQGTNRPAPLAGLNRGGYTLTFTSTPSEYTKNDETSHKSTLLRYSIGMEIDEGESMISTVAWGGPAFKAGITEGMQIIAVNGESYSGDLLKRAITVAATNAEPITLILKRSDRYTVATIDYHGGLKYPHLERDPKVPALFDEILAARH
jgi:predicted metalloprotease with PDZ domain